MRRAEGAERLAGQPPDVRVRERADRARATAGDLLAAVAALEARSRDLAERQRPA